MTDEAPSRGEIKSVPPPVVKPHKNNTRLYLIGAVIAIVAILFIALLTISVHPDLPPEQRASYPYTTTYSVFLPEGKEILIAGIPIIALTAGDEMIMKIGDKNEKFVIGETKTISERKAEFRMLGLPVLSTNYLITATFRGRVNNNAEFSLIIRTSKQVPSFLIERILPQEIQAKPA
ncbi:MAG: hypothetical protein ACP5NN_05160 [Methanolinea sp.]